MRLLNAKLRTLKSFHGPDAPPYVVLSHTWGEEEVSFQDVSGPGNLSHLKGYQKISRCCEQAVADDYQWVWIDTCCIDKTSSAELSEAINSMFQWYQKADICYVYLSDFDCNGDPTSRIPELANSRWFTRGWTLQELIAPLEVAFYNSKWLEIGTRNSLSRTLSKITGIDIRVLEGVSCDHYSVARRMSWASRRVTTRLEDEAYCLMGMFGVNMPLLYGEGKKAFFRLQEEIMKGSDDHSLFAWTSGRRLLPYTGLLAWSPREFLQSGNIERLAHGPKSQPYSITNKGVQITLPVISSSFMQLSRGPFTHSESIDLKWRPYEKAIELVPADIPADRKVALLNCQMIGAPGRRIGIVLTTETAASRDIYRADFLRSHSHFHLFSPEQVFESEKTVTETLYIGVPDMDPLISSLCNMNDLRCCSIRTNLSEIDAFRVNSYPNDVWTRSRLAMALNLRTSLNNKGFTALLSFEDDRMGFAVLWQLKNNRFYADAVDFQAGEHPRDILARYDKDPRPQDRVTQKFSCVEIKPVIGEEDIPIQRRVVSVSINIKKCQRGQVADISIRTDILHMVDVYRSFSLGRSMPILGYRNTNPKLVEVGLQSDSMFRDAIISATDTLDQHLLPDKVTMEETPVSLAKNRAVPVQNGSDDPPHRQSSAAAVRALI